MPRASLIHRFGSPLRALIAALGVAIALGTGLACDRNALGPKEVGPDGRAIGRVAVVVPVGSQQATLVSVTVSAPDIIPSMVFNFPVIGGVATGSIAVPAGSGRLITVSAFDGAVETHRGTTTLTINAGANPTTSITLAPLAGTVPITATFGSVVITVTPNTASPKVGDTLRFNATIRDASGAIVPGPARWATTNPAKVVIDTAGLATVLDTGNVLVVATYSTTAATASLSLQPGTGGPTPAFLRTWVGGSGTGATRTRWDVANNWTPAFVPTQNDSVVIAAATFQPIIPVDTFSVRDLILRTGALLDAFCCGIRLRVTHVASGEGGAFGGSITGLLPRNGAVLQGKLLTNINVGPAAAVQLADTATIGSLNVDGAGAAFALAGKRLAITGNVLVNNGGLLRSIVATDTLDVAGQFQMTSSSATHLGSITAGTMILRGATNYLDAMQASGTHTVVFQPVAPLTQQIYNMNFNSVAANAFENVVVGTGSTVNICSYVRVQGSLTVNAGATGVTSCSSYTLKVEGPFTTPAGSTVNGSMVVQLMHASGTANVGGAWAPAYTDFLTPSQTVKGGLSYQNVRFFASQTLVDTVQITGQLQIDGASTVMAITAPRRIIAGSLLLTTSGTFSLDQPGDTLEIRGDLNTGSGGNSLGKLTDGVAIVWGNFYGNQYSGTGNNTVIMAGTTAQQILYGFNPGATPATGLVNLKLAGTAGANLCSTVKVSGALDITTATTFTSCSSYNLIVNGPLTTALGSTVNLFQAQLSHASGTSNVNGAWSPAYTDVAQPNIAIKAGLSYQNLRFFATDTLPAGNFRVFQHLTVDGLTTVLALKGTKFQVDSQATIQNSGKIQMANGDTMSVGGNLNWNSTNFSTPTGGQINAGGQYLNLNGYQPSGTAKLKLVGTSQAQHLNTTDPVNRPLNRLEVANPFGMVIDGNVAIADTFAVTVSGPNANVVSGYYYDLEVRGAFVTAPGSSVYPRALNLAGTSTLTNVGGTLAPGILRVYTTVPGALHNAPNYQFSQVDFYTSYTLTDTLTAVVNTVAYGSPYPGAVSINNTGNVLDLNGKRMRLAGYFDANTLATLKMTNPLDSLLVGDGSTSSSGNIYLDGGAGTSSALTAGTIVLRGNANVPNATFGPAHTLVFTDSGLGPVARTYSIYANSGQVFGNVVIRGSSQLTVQPNSNYTVAGSFDLRSGPTFFGPYYYTWAVTGPVTTAAGSNVTAAANVNFIVQLSDPSGTANVSGLWSPSTTRFVANNQTIKTGLAYQSLDFAASATIAANLTVSGNINTSGGTLAFGANKITMGGSLTANGASTVLAFGASQVNVGAGLGLGTGATLSMTNTLDTLIVAGNFSSDNNQANSTVTAGTIRVKGDVNAGRLNPTGTSWLILDSLNSAATQHFSTNITALNKVRIATQRYVQFDGSMTFNDSLVVASPTIVGYQGYNGYTYVFNGPISSVASSTITGGSWQLQHLSGTSQINGVWTPNVTRIMSVGTLLKPTLGYQNLECNATCSFSGNTTMAGYLYATGNGTIVIPNGHTLTMGNYFQLATGAIVQMTSPTDSLLIGNYIGTDNGVNNSIATDGVIRVRGDVNVNRLNPTGASKIILDSLTSGAVQNFYTSSTPINRLQVLTQRTVQFNSTMTFTDSVVISTPTTVGYPGYSGYTFIFNGPVKSIAASTLQGSNLRFQDVTAADNVLGFLTTPNEVQIAANTGTPNLPYAPGRFTYNTLRLLSGFAQVPSGAAFQLGSGPSGGNVAGTLILATSTVLTIPSGASLRICNGTTQGLQFATSPPASIINGGSFLLSQNAASLGVPVTSLLPGTTQYGQTCP